MAEITSIQPNKSLRVGTVKAITRRAPHTDLHRDCAEREIDLAGSIFTHQRIPVNQRLSP